jgi:hypothetical protein
MMNRLQTLFCKFNLRRYIEVGITLLQLAECKVWCCKLKPERKCLVLPVVLEIQIQETAMTFKDKPTFETVNFGPFNSRRLQLKYIFERGLVFKCHIKFICQSRRPPLQQGEERLDDAGRAGQPAGR